MTQENTKPARDELGRLLPGHSLNPGGRLAKTDEQRAAEEYLRDKTLAAAKKLVALQDSGDEKIALGAVVAHLKMAIGELQRVAGKEGANLLGIDFAGWTPEQILELARSGK